MNIQRFEENNVVVYTLKDDEDKRTRQIGFVVDPMREVHRLSFTNGMVDLSIKNQPIGLLYQLWLVLAPEQACHLCSFEEALASLENRE